jgi:hypothetical protein
MATATNDHLGDVRRRIARLEVQAQRGSADAKLRLRRYIDTLRREEESARASVRERAAAVDERLERLENELELAEHRVAAEFAATKEQFAEEIDAELRRWDAFLNRLQGKAAEKSGVARERAEAAIADLRRLRVAIGKSLADVGTTVGEQWHDAKQRVLAELDDLKSQADAAWHNRERNET